MKILSEIQTALHAPKSNVNNHAGYTFRKIDDILDAVKPLLQGAIITLDDDVILLSERSKHVETNRNGEQVLESDRVYIKSTATITMGDESVSCSSFARESLWKAGSDPAQITGSASTYARKRALEGLLLLDDNDDADSQAKHDTAVAHSKPAIMASSTQIENIKTLADSAGMEAEAIATGVKWASAQRTHNVEELSQDEAAKYIAMITKKIKQKEIESNA